MHHYADAHLDDILCKKHGWNGSTACAESKHHDVILAFAVARRWRDVLSNSLEPGWVPTKIGGSGAPDDLDQARLTQAWLAASDEPDAKAPAGTSTISICSPRTPRPTTPSFKIASSRSAPSYRASRSRLEHAPAQQHRLERNDLSQVLT
jgi:NAD(P)-dependent dehydrogenase (short-subunit alcohol dehydrogenase family)